MVGTRGTIVGILSDRGIDTGKTSIEAAADITAAMEALHRAGFTLVLLSPDYQVTLRPPRRRWWRRKEG